MNEKLKEAKQGVRAFMRLNYTDERLGWLLAHARDGKLGFDTCCCFIGVVTADHPLHANGDFEDGDRHYNLASALPLSNTAENAFYRLGIVNGRYPANANAVRRRRLVPIIKVEMRRRQREREATTPPRRETSQERPAEVETVGA